jgi:hypothetical protein
MTRRAISLMRSMMRVSRGWCGEGGDAEAAFIVTETRRVFRERRGLAAGSAEAEAALEEGENRLELALHYRIAYDRMAHLPLSGGGDVKHVLPPADFAATEKDDWAAHVGAHGVSHASAHLASVSHSPVNPGLNAARAKARAKRAAMARAAAAASPPSRDEEDEDDGT